MLESIGISLISTMLSFLFECNVLRKSTVDIEGAPYWYGKMENAKRLYISTYMDGGLDSVDKVKLKVIKKFTLKIEDAYKVSIKREFLHLHSKKEQLLVNKISNDSNLKNFIANNIVFQNIKYDKDIQRVFTRGYLGKDILKNYQMKRMIKIKEKLLDYQFDNMMEELDKEN